MGEWRDLLNKKDEDDILRWAEKEMGGPAGRKILEGHSLFRAWRDGEAFSNECYVKLVEKAEEYAEKNQHMEGTIMMMVAAKSMVARIERGLQEFAEKNGGDSLPQQTWDLLGAAFSGNGDTRKAMSALREWAKKHGRG